MHPITPSPCHPVTPSPDEPTAGKPARYTGCHPTTPLPDEPTAGKPARDTGCSSAAPASFDRRAMVVGGAVAVAGVLGYRLLMGAMRPREPVFLAREPSYDGPLERTIQDGLLAVEFDPASVRGRRVL